MDALSLALMMFGIAIVIIVAVIFIILNMKVYETFNI